MAHSIPNRRLPSMTHIAHRTAYLQSIGCRVLRYGNNELDTNFAGVCEDILQKIG